jgi:hypothetical protein
MEVAAATGMLGDRPINASSPVADETGNLSQPFQLSVPQPELLPPPHNSVTEKARDPHRKCDKISQRNQPPLSPNLRIPQDPLSNHHCCKRSCNQHRQQGHPSPPRTRRSDHRQSPPRQPKCHDQAKVLCKPPILDVARPSHLVLPECAARVIAQSGFDYGIG